MPINGTPNERFFFLLPCLLVASLLDRLNKFATGFANYPYTSIPYSQRVSFQEVYQMAAVSAEGLDSSTKEASECVVEPAGASVDKMDHFIKENAEVVTRAEAGDFLETVGALEHTALLGATAPHETTAAPVDLLNVAVSSNTVSRKAIVRECLLKAMLAHKVERRKKVLIIAFPFFLC